MKKENPTPKEMVEDIEDFFQLAMGHPVMYVTYEKAKELMEKNGTKLDNNDTMFLVIMPKDKTPTLMQLTTLETL